MKKWIKFIKAFTDKTDQKFEKDQVVEVDATIAKSLVDLGVAEDTDAPVDNNLFKSMMDNFSEQFQKQAIEVFEVMFKSLSEQAKKYEFEFAGLGTNVEKDALNGFKDRGEFVLAIKQAGTPGGKVDERLLVEKASSGQNTLDDAEGGFLVPPDIVNGIWEILHTNDNLFNRTDKRTTSRQSILLTTLPEQSRKEGYRDGGAVAYWTPEAGQYTPSLLKFGQQRISLNKLTALLYCTDEEIDDAAYAIAPIIDRKAANALDFKLNKSLYDGTGAGQPQGIMNSNALVTIPLEFNQDEGTILHKNLSKMYHRMHPASRNRAVWLMHPNAIEQLEFIYFADDTTNKRPVYLPPGGISNATYGSLYGRPVIPCEYCMDFGQKGDIVFADYSQYISLTKPGGGIKSSSSIHVRFVYDETAFKFSIRIGGQSAWPSPIEDFNGTTKRSPFITLANRSGGSSSSGL